MPTITVRNLNPTCHRRLRERAAANGNSMETEVRNILYSAVEPPQRTLAQAIMELGLSTGGVELELPARTDTPRGADFS